MTEYSLVGENVSAESIASLYTLKMEEIGSFKTLGITNKDTQRHNPENQNP
jgi:hypothetical protein